MIALKVCWLLAVLGMAGLMVASGSSFPFAMLLVLLLIPLLTLPLNLLARKKLRISMQTPINLGKNQRDQVYITIQNRSVLPLLRLWCRVGAENCLNGTEQTVTVSAFVLPGQTQKLPLEVGDLHCGRIKLQVKKLWLSDSFGLLQVPVSTRAHGAVTIQPDTFEQNISVGFHANAAEEAELYSQEKAGPDRSEIFQIREYQEGDSVRQIHWKLSTKLDRLVIRDPSLPITRSVLIFWERALKGPEPVEQIDAQAEALISVCKNLLNQSVRFTLGWNDTRDNHCVMQEIHDMDELIGILPRVLSARGRQVPVSGASLLAQTTDVAEYSHLIYVSGSCGPELSGLNGNGLLTVLLCGNAEAEAGTHVYRFDAAGYAEQLMELEV